MTTHKITTELLISFIPGSMVESETAYPKFEIECEYTPNEAETGPTYACGGTPASPAQIEFISAKVIDGDGIELTPEQVNDYAEEWLCGDGYQAALDEVQNDFERGM